MMQRAIAQEVEVSQQRQRKQRQVSKLFERRPAALEISDGSIDIGGFALLSAGRRGTARWKFSYSHRYLVGGQALRFLAYFQLFHVAYARHCTLFSARDASRK